MMKIRFLLEYKCFPVWLYDENDNLIDTKLPKELEPETAIEKELIEISDAYDELFIDNETEFRYIGFKDIDMKDHFFQKTSKIIETIKALIGEEYNIVDDINTRKADF